MDWKLKRQHDCTRSASSTCTWCNTLSLTLHFIRWWYPCYISDIIIYIYIDIYISVWLKQTALLSSSSCRPPPTGWKTGSSFVCHKSLAWTKQICKQLYSFPLSISSLLLDAMVVCVPLTVTMVWLWCNIAHSHCAVICHLNSNLSECGPLCLVLLRNNSRFEQAICLCVCVWLNDVTGR